MTWLIITAVVLIGIYYIGPLERFKNKEEKRRKAELAYLRERDITKQTIKI